MDTQKPQEQQSSTDKFGDMLEGALFWFLEKSKDLAVIVAETGFAMVEKVMSHGTSFLESADNKTTQGSNA